MLLTNLPFQLSFMFNFLKKKEKEKSKSSLQNGQNVVF